MISYQLFTKIAVSTSLAHVNLLLPSIGPWLLSKSDMIIFIYAFAWVFVLSSVIPSLLLGQDKSVLVQFVVILTLSLLPILIQDAVNIFYGGKPIEQLLDVTFLFSNPAIALGYLILPFVGMLFIDVRNRLKRKESSTESDSEQMVTLNLTGEEASELKEYCLENQCTQHTAVQTALKELLSRPAKPSEKQTQNEIQEEQENQRKETVTDEQKTNEIEN